MYQWNDLGCVKVFLAYASYMNETDTSNTSYLDGCLKHKLNAI